MNKLKNNGNNNNEPKKNEHKNAWNAVMYAWGK